MKKLIDRHYLLVIIIISIIGTFFRIYNLEQDAPPYNQAGLSQTDEPYYCFWAIDDYYKEKGKTIEVPEFKNYEKSVLTISSYPLTYLGLNLFGNNYFGLRIGVVAISLISILFIFLTISLLTKDRGIKLLMLILLFSDYYFSAVSRLQNPQIYSICGISCFLYFAIRGMESKAAYVASWIILLFTIVFIYPYNAFIALAYGLYSITLDIKAKKIELLNYAFLSGIIFCLLAIIIFYFSNTTLESYLKLFSSFRSKRNEIAPFSLNIMYFINGFLGIVFSNLFRYNFGYIAIILFYFFASISNRSLNKTVTLMLFIFFCAYLQSSFMPSYPFKKWVVLFPFVMIITTDLFSNSFILKDLKLKIRLIISTFIFLLFLYMLKATSSSVYWNGFSSSYSIIPLPAISLVLLTTILFTIVCLLVFLKEKFEVYILTSLIICGMIFMVKNQFIKPTFIHKELQLSLAKYNTSTTKGILINGFSHTYALNNDLITSVSPYYSGFNDISILPVIQYAKNNYLTMIYVDKTPGNPVPKIDSSVTFQDEKFIFETRIANNKYGFNIYKHIN